MINDGLELMKVEEVAKELSCCSNVVYSLVHRKIIPANKIGGKWLISRNVLVGMLERGEIRDNGKDEDTNPAA